MVTVLRRLKSWVLLAAVVAVIGLFAVGGWILALGTSQGRFEGEGRAETECTILKVATAPPWTVMSQEEAFTPMIEYEYEVLGRRWKGTRFAGDPDHVRLSFQEAESLLVNLRPGSVTTCWVNEEDPSDAVLHFTWGEPKWALGIAILSAILLGLIGVARYLASDGDRRARRRAPAAQAPGDRPPTE